jgi:glutamyl-tRNA reductase
VRSSAPPIVALTAHARQVSADARERLATDLRGAIVGRGVVIETCHRVEGYVAGAEDVARARRLRMPPGGRILADGEAVRHAIAVAVGRDSVVVGEDQIVHQLRTSLETARSGGFDPVLDRLFAHALRSARLARSWRQGPVNSLATLALSTIEGRIGSVRGRTLLVVGTGQMGRLAARAAIAEGAAVMVASRTSDRAETLARTVAARSVEFDPATAVERVDAVIVAIRGPWVISPTTLRSLARGPAVVVDLSVPTAVPENLVSRLGPRLITADDLARAAAEPVPAHDPSLVRMDALIEQSAREFENWLAGHARRGAAASLTARAEAAREAELAALWRRLPELDPSARGAIDAMTRHLASELLREPLEQLGRDADGRVERAVREVFAL